MLKSLLWLNQWNTVWTMARQLGSFIYIYFTARGQWNQAAIRSIFLIQRQFRHIINSYGMLIWLSLIKNGCGIVEKDNFKKWHKHECLGILNFMLGNERVAWNMFTEIDSIIRKKCKKLKLESLRCWVDVELAWSSSNRNQLWCYLALQWWWFPSCTGKFIMENKIISHM